MAKQQVKFYSMTEAAFSTATKDTGGIYFISDKNEIYKGATRFGAAKVFTVANEEGLAGLTGMVRGDLAITGAGAAWTYVGSSENEGWKPIGGDISALQASWRADIVAWTEGLVMSTSSGYSSAAGALNIITDIVADEDGKLTAVVQELPWADLVSRVETLETKVSDIETVVQITKDGQGDITDTLVSANTVSATDGNFTNITASAATFSATTVGGVALNNISASSLTGSNAGVAVTVSTGNGGVKAVDVVVSGNLATFAEKSVVTAISSSATDAEIPTAKAIATKFATLDNAMHFRGVYTSTGGVGSPAAGDVIVIGAEPYTGFVAGQEYVYTTESTWELIGDQGTYATKAYVDAADALKASIGTGNAAGANGISGTVVLASDAGPTLSLYVTPVTTSTGITTGTTSIVTAGAVADYVNAAVTTLDTNKASVGASVSGSNSVQVSVQLFSNAEPKVFIAGVGTVASMNVLGDGVVFGNSATGIPTASQVYSYVEGKVGAVSAAGVSFAVPDNAKIFEATDSNVQLALETVDAEVGTLNAAVSNFTYSSVTGGSGVSISNGVTVSVVTASTTAVPTVYIDGVGTAASKNFADTLVSTGNSLPTESAVYAAITTALATSIDDLDSTVASTTPSGGWGVSITQVDGLLSTVTLSVNKMSALEELDLVWMDASGAIDIQPSSEI